MSDPDFNLFSTMQQHLNFIGTSLAVTAPTTTGGQTALNWPNNTNGNAFSNQGFNSTSNYEIQYNGTITIKTGGNYTFSTGSDDGSILAVDNNFVVNNNYFQGFENRYGSVTLSAGTHTISIGYFQGGGSAGLVVDYQGPDSGNNLIPIPNSASLLYGLFTVHRPILCQRCFRHREFNDRRFRFAERIHGPIIDQWQHLVRHQQRYHREPVQSFALRPLHCPATPRSMSRTAPVAARAL